MSKIERSAELSDNDDERQEPQYAVCQDCRPPSPSLFEVTLVDQPFTPNKELAVIIAEQTRELLARKPLHFEIIGKVAGVVLEGKYLQHVAIEAEGYGGPQTIELPLTLEEEDSLRPLTGKRVRLTIVVEQL